VSFGGVFRVSRQIRHELVRTVVSPLLAVVEGIFRIKIEVLSGPVTAILTTLIKQILTHTL
jgi:hypothetical protein